MFKQAIQSPSLDSCRTLVSSDNSHNQAPFFSLLFSVSFLKEKKIKISVFIYTEPRTLGKPKTPVAFATRSEKGSAGLA